MEEDIFEDIDFDIIDDDEPTVMGYRELEQRQRAGAEIMATEIEGSGALARAQQKLEFKQAGSSTERALLSFFKELKNHYKRFAPNEEVLMFDKFKSLSYSTYKNPYAYLLAYIAVREGGLTRSNLHDLLNIVKDANISNVEEADIIRYARLLTKRI